MFSFLHCVLLGALQGISFVYVYKIFGWCRQTYCFLIKLEFKARKRWGKWSHARFTHQNLIRGSSEGMGRKGNVKQKSQLRTDLCFVNSCSCHWLVRLCLFELVVAFHGWSVGSPWRQSISSPRVGSRDVSRPALREHQSWAALAAHRGVLPLPGLSLISSLRHPRELHPGLSSKAH